MVLSSSVLGMGQAPREPIKHKINKRVGASSFSEFFKRVGKLANRKNVCSEVEKACVRKRKKHVFENGKSVCSNMEEAEKSVCSK